MTIGLSREDEVKYLNKTIETIDNLLGSFGDFKNKQGGEIKSNRKFLWDSMKEMDEIEVQSLTEDLKVQEKLYINNQKKINTLMAQRNTPYFARIDFKEDGEEDAESLYIGISSVLEGDFNFLVLDWRSPISNMFYDYEMGKASYEAPFGVIEGEIVLNRQYNIKNSELKFIHDSSSSLHDEALLDVLSSNTSEKMKNIVSSIQREQNSIIRNEDAKILLLQGVAGSGKTSIAMHRAAYLLYKFRKTLKASNVLIFSPNDVFSEYISEVLPGLGEENIGTTTLEKYSKRFLPTNYSYESKNAYLEYLYEGKDGSDYALREASMKYKNSFEFVEVLDKFISDMPSFLGDFKGIYLDGVEIIKKGKVIDTFKVRFKDVPLLKRIESLKESLFSQVETMYLAQSKNKNASDFGYDPMDSGVSIEEYFKNEINEQVSKMFPTLNAVFIYNKLWERIFYYTKEDLSEIKKFTLDSISKSTILYEDIVPLIYIRSMMEGFRSYSEIKHIIIDECQDYSPLFYLLIKKSFNNASATILGDLNQRITGANSLSKKEEISKIFGEENTTLATLKKSYRSTLDITNFSKGILISGEDIEGVERTGLPPMIYKEQKDFVELIGEMKARGMNSIAIIPKTSKEALRFYEDLRSKISDIKLIIDTDTSYGTGISIIPSYIAKGLEFDGVIVPDGDIDSYNLDSERNLLYTVCSRALHELHIMTNGNPSILLP